MGSPVSQVASSTQPSAKGAGQSTGKSGFSNIAPSQNDGGSASDVLITNGKNNQLSQLSGKGSSTQITDFNTPNNTTYLNKENQLQTTQLNSKLPDGNVNNSQPTSASQIVPTGISNKQPQGKGSPTQATNFAQPNKVTFPGQGGQPQMGQPNTYSNTVGQWDNASIQPRQTQSGKGKGY